MITDREKFICLVSNDTLQKGDAIILLEGDGLNRIKETARLFKEGYAPIVVISGGMKNPPTSLPASEMKPELVRAGVPQKFIVLEEKSLNTLEQGAEIMKMVKARNWRTIIIIASNFHQYRAYLIFLKAMRDAGIVINMINAPARDLSWFKDERDVGGQRINVLENEFEKIDKYTKSGQIASFQNALDYFKWKEKNINNKK